MIEDARELFEPPQQLLDFPEALLKQQSKYNDDEAGENTSRTSDETFDSTGSCHDRLLEESGFVSSPMQSLSKSLQELNQLSLNESRNSLGGGISQRATGMDDQADDISLASTDAITSVDVIVSAKLVVVGTEEQAEQTSRDERRKKRLQILKAGREKRMEQAAMEHNVMGPFMEDHPYYGALRKEHFKALEGESGNSSTSERPSAQVETALRSELVSAYQLVHRQRVRIQHLEKSGHDPHFHDPSMFPITATSSQPLCRRVSGCQHRENNDSDQDRELIAQLQRQVVQLKLNQALMDFDYRTRIARDAEDHRSSIQHWKDDAADWKDRFDMAFETMEEKLAEAQSRFEGLEKRFRNEEQHPCCSPETQKPISESLKPKNGTPKTGKNSIRSRGLLSKYRSGKAQRSSSDTRKVSWSQNTIFHALSEGEEDGYGSSDDDIFLDHDENSVSSRSNDMNDLTKAVMEVIKEQEDDRF